MFKHGGYFGENKKDVIDFSVNVNPLGVSDKVIKKIKSNLNEICRYPEINGDSARKLLANHLNVKDKQIILGNGATELIYLFARSIKAERILIIQPTFTEYERGFKTSGAKVYNYITKLEDNFNINIDDLLNKINDIKPDVVVVCNPNNPTGVFTEYDEFMPILDFLKRKNIYLFLDESFIDLCINNNSYIDLIEKYPIFILRSMTKFYAIPGLRLGYGIGNEIIIDMLNKFKEPWTINGLALSIVPTILQDISYEQDTRKWFLEEKEFLYNGLKKIKGISIYPSSTNFYLCKLESMSLDRFKYELLNYNIYIRMCDDFIGLDNLYFRLAVRNHNENDRLIRCINDILKF